MQLLASCISKSDRSTLALRGILWLAEKRRTTKWTGFYLHSFLPLERDPFAARDVGERNSCY
jgi:hypothetical protein